jgi:hypothetical protein
MMYISHLSGVITAGLRWLASVEGQALLAKSVIFLESAIFYVKAAIAKAILFIASVRSKFTAPLAAVA